MGLGRFLFFVYILVESVWNLYVSRGTAVWSHFEVKKKPLVIGYIFSFNEINNLIRTDKEKALIDIGVSIRATD